MRSIYAKCWIVRLNRQQVAEIHDDVDYAMAWVERLICDELERIEPHVQRIKAHVPPTECFWGQDAVIKWRNWREDRAVEGWTFTGPTLRQIQAALKAKK